MSRRLEQQHNDVMYDDKHFVISKDTEHIKPLDSRRAHNVAFRIVAAACKYILEWMSNFFP